MAEICTLQVLYFKYWWVKIKKLPFKNFFFASLTDVGHTISMQLHYYNVIVMYILLVFFSV